MKKLFVLAVVAAIMMAGSAIAAPRHLIAEPNATFANGIGPTTTNNDDSCDIGVTPAATLLLPYFQVDTAARAVDTFFTITNVSNVPTIAHVVVWTDWSFPVLDFNIFLTGYDVQPISMYDIIVNGVIAPLPGSSTAGGTGVGSPDDNGYYTGYGNTTFGRTNLNPPTRTSLPVTVVSSGNPHIAIGTLAEGCGSLPGAYNPAIRAAVQSALVNGTYAIAGAPSVSCALAVGSAAGSGTHPANTAIGYVTVDVASDCSTSLATDPAYFTTEILFDNVLIGDYQILDKTVGSNYAAANPMVHIRAVPEGGAPGYAPTNLPDTFYSRYVNTAGTTTPNADRRQPLPSVFAARWIAGGPAGLATNFRIWREGRTGSNTDATRPTSCAEYSADTGSSWVRQYNRTIPVREFVRFDEHENANVFTSTRDVSPPITPSASSLPETSLVSSTSSVFPSATFPSGDTGGWMYMNLDNNYYSAGRGAPFGYSPTLGARASQNWVIVAMTGTGSTAGAYAGDFDAAWLANGCNPAVPVSTWSSSTSAARGVPGVYVMEQPCIAPPYPDGTPYQDSTAGPCGQIENTTPPFPATMLGVH